MTKMVENKSISADGFKVISWNINGIRTVKNLKQMLDDLEADIICLQETKVTSKWGHSFPVKYF